MKRVLSVALLSTALLPAGTGSPDNGKEPVHRRFVIFLHLFLHLERHVSYLAPTALKLLYHLKIYLLCGIYLIYQCAFFSQIIGFSPPPFGQVSRFSQKTCRTQP